MQIKKKICLLGSYGVGKTSLVRQFVYNKFEEKYLSTIGVNISKKTLVLSKDNTDVELELFIWDIANIEKFDSVVKSYLRGAHGAILVTDITRPNTKDYITDYVKEFSGVNPNAKIVGVGNKIDLATELDFSEEEYIADLDLRKEHFYFTSAKTGKNIDDVFNSLGIQLCEDHKS